MYSSRTTHVRAARPSTRQPIGRSRRVSFGFLQPASTHGSKRDVARQGLFGLGVPEIAVIAGVAALIFGPSKLPELGKAAGQTAKSFQDAAKEFNEELKRGMEEGETRSSSDAKEDGDQDSKTAANEAARPAVTEKVPEKIEKKE